MKKTPLLAVLISFWIGVPIASALAADSKDKAFGGELYFRTSYVLENLSALPFDFAPEHVAPPTVLGLRSSLRGMAAGGATLVDLHVGVPRYTWNPSYGGMLGAGFKEDHAEFLLGMQLEFSGDLAHPTSSSQLRTWYWAPMVHLGLNFGPIHPFGSLRWINLATTDMINLEDLPTEIAHAATYHAKVGARVELPIVRAEASLGIYSLGAVAIASKGFGYLIGRQTALRPEIGAGVAIGPIEGWVRGWAVFNSRADDPIEYLYQAPFTDNDNLMVRRGLTGEIKWKF